MSTVLLRLEGPIQAWGIQSRFDERDTGTEPSKSGVLGLVASALGIRRDDDARVQELAGLAFAVRVDREGRLLRDYQTAGGGSWPGRPSYGVAKASGAKGETVRSNRAYLADASFLAALSGPGQQVASIAGALDAPVWPLFLGRRAFAPSCPILAGLRPELDDPSEALRHEAWTNRVGDETPARLRLVRDARPGEAGAARCDVPVSFRSDSRLFALRNVIVETIETKMLPEGRGAACSSPGSS